MRHHQLFAMPALLAASFLSVPAAAQSDPEMVADQAGVDYAGFVELTAEAGNYRQDRLLSWADFDTRSRQGDALILDTRSAAAFAAGHINGAVNLPFSDFTAEKLEEIIGDQERPIFIYCNNNFADDRPPIMLKSAPLALNIPTFINLYGYGYQEIWELGEVVTLDEVDWVAADS